MKIEKSKILILVYENKKIINLSQIEVDGEKLNEIEDMDKILDLYWEENVGENQCILSYVEKFGIWSDIINRNFSGRTKWEYEKWVEKITSILEVGDDFDAIAQKCINLKNNVKEISTETQKSKKFLKFTSELLLDNGDNFANAFKTSCPEKGCALLMVMDEMKVNVEQGTQVRFISRSFTPDIFNILPAHIQNSIDNCKPGTFYTVFMDMKNSLISGFFVALNNGKAILN